MSRLLAAAVIASLTALEALLPGVQHVAGSLAAFGLAGCVAIVLVAELLDWAGLTRPESPDE
ncbi:MAG: hypothetical protein EHM88_18935 [Candidatus Rokuibacteriota bacterium]|nr:MAG: hypothetical protein EHM88_18935 [Candidatus Rokubacteria bacterium]